MNSNFNVPLTREQMKEYGDWESGIEHKFCAHERKFYRILADRDDLDEWYKLSQFCPTDGTPFAFYTPSIDEDGPVIGESKMTNVSFSDSSLAMLLKRASDWLFDHANQDTTNVEYGFNDEFGDHYLTLRFEHR